MTYTVIKQALHASTSLPPQFWATNYYRHEYSFQLTCIVTMHSNPAECHFRLPCFGNSSIRLLSNEIMKCFRVLQIHHRSFSRILGQHSTEFSYSRFQKIFLHVVARTDLVGRHVPGIHQKKLGVMPSERSSEESQIRS